MKPRLTTNLLMWVVVLADLVFRCDLLVGFSKKGLTLYVNRFLWPPDWWLVVKRYAPKVFYQYCIVIHNTVSVHYSGAEVPRQESIWYVISQRRQLKVQTAGSYQILLTCKVQCQCPLTWSSQQGDVTSSRFHSASNPSIYISTKQTA